jgi:hypothetical protein
LLNPLVEMADREQDMLGFALAVVPILTKASGKGLLCSAGYSFANSRAWPTPISSSANASVTAAVSSVNLTRWVYVVNFFMWRCGRPRIFRHPGCT